MQADTDTELLAVARPTPSRRALAVGAMTALGLAVIYVALAQSGSLASRVVLLVIGLGGLGCAHLTRRATGAAIELTRTELRDSEGALIAKVENMTRVDRGMFAFKPSNGFLIRTVEPQKRGWRFGLWWRMGKQVGVGGMLPARETKLMAETLSTLIENRAQGG